MIFIEKVMFTEPYLYTQRVIDQLHKIFTDLTRIIFLNTLGKNWTKLTKIQFGKNFVRQMTKFVNRMKSKLIFILYPKVTRFKNYLDIVIFTNSMVTILDIWWNRTICIFSVSTCYILYWKIENHYINEIKAKFWKLTCLHLDITGPLEMKTILLWEVEKGYFGKRQSRRTSPIKREIKTVAGLGNSYLIHIMYLFPIFASKYWTTDAFRLNLCLKF